MQSQRIYFLNILIVTFGDFVMQNLRLIDYTHSGGYIISKRPSHSESRDILLFDPDPEGTHLVSIFISIRENPAPIHLYPHSFSLVFGFMVSWKAFKAPLLSSPQSFWWASRKEHCSTVSQISTVKIVFVDVNHTCCAAREHNVDAWL